MTDFRVVKDVARGVIDSVNVKDPNWSWAVELDTAVEDIQRR